MGRINLTTLLTVVALTAAVSIAFAFNWSHWQRLAAAQKSRERVSQDIAIQDRNTRERRLQLKDVLTHTAAPDTPREDPIFYAQLKRLTDASGVQTTIMAPATPTPLPTIGTALTPVKPTLGASSGTAKTPDDKKKEDNKNPEYSLTNLPLRVRPITTNLTVVGTFRNVNIFIRNLYNFRFSGSGVHYSAPRCININSLQINGGDADGSVHARMMLTRFVYKPDADTAPSGGVSDGPASATPAIVSPSAPDTLSNTKK